MRQQLARRFPRLLSDRTRAPLGSCLNGTRSRDGPSFVERRSGQTVKDGRLVRRQQRSLDLLVLRLDQIADAIFSASTRGGASARNRELCKCFSVELADVRSDID